jgi:hypothetical protein
VSGLTDGGCGGREERMKGQRAIELRVNGKGTWRQCRVYQFSGVQEDAHLKWTTPSASKEEKGEGWE